MAEPIATVASIAMNPAESLQDALQAVTPVQQMATQKSFAVMLSEGLDVVSGKVTHANQMVRDFSVDETVPIHQVTIALEDARMSVELASQVRQRLIEGYREIMNMQL